MTALVSFTEVVANSNSPVIVFSGKTFSNTTANGNVFSVLAGGFISPGNFGSISLTPSVTLNVYVGPLGTSGDPLLISTVIPAFEINQISQGVQLGGPPGNFSFNTLVALRANAGASNANGVYSAFVLSPFAVHSAPGANGNVSSTWSGGAGGGNTANITITAVCGGQGSNAVFEIAAISPLT
jgi:hypothetical protein